MVHQAAQNRVNVVEDFPLYDTVQIRIGASSVEGYVSYALLGAADEIPFFSVRNRSEVGLAYTNKESKDAMPFAYGIHSIGVQFLAASPYLGSIKQDPTAARVPVEGDTISDWFNKVLPLHCGLVLKVREDEKVLTTCELCPAGTGITGVNYSADNSSSNILTNGHPDISSRFKFSPAIDVPRGAVLQVVLKPSRYAREVLAATTAGIPATIGPATGFMAKNLCGLIRVSLLGKRAVQQRGQLSV